LRRAIFLCFSTSRDIHLEMKTPIMVWLDHVSESVPPAQRSAQPALFWTNAQHTFHICVLRGCRECGCSIPYSLSCALQYCVLGIKRHSCKRKRLYFQAREAWLQHARDLEGKKFTDQPPLLQKCRIKTGSRSKTRKNFNQQYAARKRYGYEESGAGAPFVS